MRTNDDTLGLPGARQLVEDGPRIFVVDDEPQIRELVAAALERQGYRVTAFADGHDALEELRKGDVHLLLTDLKMPRLGGLDLIRAAKELLPDLGSILITAYSSTETAVQALRYGADDYLAKPFGLDELRATVGRVLASRRMVRYERDAVVRVREEASSLRVEHERTQAELIETRADLRTSREDLERRVTDLEFVRELTHLLARKGDLQRLLQTTAAVLARRFRATVTRIELSLPDGVHVAEHRGGPAPGRVLAAMGPTLIQRARKRPDGVVCDMVLGFGSPLEGLASHLTVAGASAGGITILRPAAAGDPGDDGLLALVTPSLVVAVEAELHRQRAEQNALGVALGILEELEGRGSLFAGHSERVSRLAASIAAALGLSPRLRAVIETAARLHDVGGVGVPDDLLQREGPLSSAELETIRSAPVVGARILAPFGEAAAFVRHQRERPDGGGYPDGLVGDDIPLGAGIIGVAEAFDAITSARPYRRSRSRREALDEILALRGTQFVPEAVDGLIAVPLERI